MTDRPEESVLQEADRLVVGARQDAYGHPKIDFARTADFWTAYLFHRYGFGFNLRPDDIGLMMILLKLSREMNRHGRDNLVDIAGYAKTVVMCLEGEDE